MGRATRENSSHSRTSNPTLGLLTKILFSSYPSSRTSQKLEASTISLHHKQPKVGARMICVLSGGNGLTATVRRWRNRRHSWWLAMVLVVARGDAIGHSSSSLFSF
ncbi:hypothetical protein V8G54_026185 [Vigna mungo]|uniref:Uncharacterized protein n=1 Tax=Vigna mungo TaxID=3915 RepID=A0AAQ3MZZ2_VIGMU